MRYVNNLYKLTIGDYWNDGHGKHINYKFLTNVTNEQMEKAYWDSCKLVGIQFHTNGNAHGLEYDWQTDERRDFYVLNNYQDGVISEGAMKKMKAHGLEEYNPFSRQPNTKQNEEYWHWEEMFATYGEEVPTDNDFFHLIMWFLGLSLLEDFVYEVIKEPEEALSEMIGYGMFN